MAAGYCRPANLLAVLAWLDAGDKRVGQNIAGRGYKSKSGSLPSRAGVAWRGLARSSLISERYQIEQGNEAECGEGCRLLAAGCRLHTRHLPETFIT